MAKKSVYIPFYQDGAYHWLEVTGEYNGPVPEGQPAVKAIATTSTPPMRLQPPLRPKGGPK